uniref:Uncharacterized protein n=1 Tax=Tanacetum cinerariifolium TaxID=118510 RepID=A0A6L2MZ96_TANCI|nr:hypothetical protein [Tanacetum cinerariifolium]
MQSKIKSGAIAEKEVELMLEVARSCINYRRQYLASSYTKGKSSQMGRSKQSSTQKDCFPPPSLSCYGFRLWDCCLSRRVSFSFALTLVGRIAFPSLCSSHQHPELYHPSLVPLVQKA